MRKSLFISLLLILFFSFMLYSQDSRAGSEITGRVDILLIEIYIDPHIDANFHEKTIGDHWRGCAV